MTTAVGTVPLESAFYDLRPLTDAIDIAHLIIAKLGHILSLIMAASATFYWGWPAAASYLALAILARLSPLAALERGDFDEANRSIRSRTAIPISSVSPECAFAALATGRTDIVEALLQKGLDVHIRDREGNTLLHKAISAEQISLLCRRGADAYTPNGQGLRPLLIAAELWPFEALQALLQEGNSSPAELDAAFEVALAANRPAALLDLFGHAILYRRDASLYKAARSHPAAFLYLIGKRATLLPTGYSEDVDDDIQRAAYACEQIAFHRQSANPEVGDFIQEGIDRLNALRGDYALPPLPPDWTPPETLKISI